MRLDILIDIDGILSDFWTEWATRLKARTGIDMSLDRVVDYEIIGMLPPEHHDAARAIWGEPGFMTALAPIAGAQQGIADLSGDGHRLFIISKPAYPAQSGERTMWVQRHFPQIPDDAFIFTHHKELVRGNVLIEDNPAFIRSYRENWPRSMVCGIEWPYNRSEYGLLPSWKDTRLAWFCIVDRIRQFAGLRP